MRAALERASAETSGVGMYLLAAYYFLANNFAIVLMIFGALTIVWGATIMSGIPIGLLEHQTLAGMFGVWGVSIIALGVFLYAIFWVNQLIARLTTDSGDEGAGDAGSGGSSADADSGTDLSL